MSDAEPTPLTILGRTIGTSTGWDGDPGACIVLYDFVPGEACKGNIPAGRLYFTEEVGDLYVEDDTGKEIFRADAVTFLANVPRDPA